MSGWRRLGLAALTALASCTSAPVEVTTSTTTAEGVISPSSTTSSTLLVEPGSEPVVELVAPTSAAENCDVAPTTVELFACWQRNRALVVDRLRNGIEAGDWGVGVDQVLRGPGGLEVDLAECGDEWSDTAGIEADTIHLAQISALSGGIAQSSYYPGLAAYLDHVNEAGGVGGRQVALSVHDDSYVPSATREIIDGLVAADEVLAVHTYGFLNTLAVAPLLEGACMPVPFVRAAHPAFGDGEQFSWLVGGELSIRAEVEIWLTWLEEEHPDRLPLTAAAIVMGGYGDFYETAFREAIERRPGIVSDFNAVRHDPAAPDISPQVAEVAGFDPDIYIQMTAANPCLLALKSAKENGLVANVDRPDRIAITVSVCTQANAYLIPAGDAGNGLVAVERNVAFAPGLAIEPGDDTFTSWVKDELAPNDLDWQVSLNWVGVDVGWSLVEALRIADALPGGLSRSNLLLTLHALDLDHPALPPGVAYQTNGSADRHLIEGGQMMEYNAQTQQWTDLRTTDVDGQTPSCRWEYGPQTELTDNYYTETYNGRCLENP